MRRLILAAAACSVFALGPSAGQATTAGELIDWCKRKADLPGDSDLCEMYIGTSVQIFSKDKEALRHGLKLCVPESARMSTLVRKTTAWIAADPARRNVPVGEAVARALQADYGCK